MFHRKQLGEDETRKYIRQIVSAVDHMHHAYVIHRDIKLQNFMLDKNNDIVIIGEDYFCCLRISEQNDKSHFLL